MTIIEKNKKIAEAVGLDLWVICKNGYYYRENACGYTSSLAEAWKLPKAEAKKYEMYVDNPRVPACDTVSIERVPVPNYFKDLGAIHAEIRKLDDKQFHEFTLALNDLSWERFPKQTYVSNEDYINRLRISFAGTAEEQAEAFGRFLGLWGNQKSL